MSLALAMDVEHEASDRRGGIGAIMHQFVEIGIARLGRVHAKGMEQVERMARRELRVGENCAQRLRGLDPVVPAEQRRLETVEPGELFVRAQVRAIVGDIVGGADESDRRRA